MKYHDGQEIKLYDRVKLGEDSEGVIVCLIDTGAYSGYCTKGQWDYLEKGVMVEFPSYGLIHYENPEPDLMLIERGKIDGSKPKKGL